jgi:hypothetical protein
MNESESPPFSWIPTHRQNDPMLGTSWIAGLQAELVRIRA